MKRPESIWGQRWWDNWYVRSELGWGSSLYFWDYTAGQMKECLFSPWLRNAVFSMINVERMVEMLLEAW